MLMLPRHPALQFTHPLPYGAILHDHGVQFVVFSRSATSMKVLLYDRAADLEPSARIIYNRDTDRWGDIWSVFVPHVGAGQLYHFQAEGPFDPESGQRFDGRARLIDPYARALAGDFLPTPDGSVHPPKCVVVDDRFDWQGDRHLRRDLSETVIYEMHVRGFTRSPSSGVRHPGTYLGVIEKIPYLKSLGVTAVELMPVHEFPTNGFWGEPKPLGNYWGYDPIAFFAPHRGYATSSEPGTDVVGHSGVFGRDQVPDRLRSASDRGIQLPSRKFDPVVEVQDRWFAGSGAVHHCRQQRPRGIIETVVEDDHVRLSQA